MSLLRTHKSWVALGLILSLILPVLCVQVWFESEKKQAKREVKRMIKAGLRREEMVVFSFAKAEVKTKVRWEHSKEFEYKGEMYDVISSAEENDTLTFWCWHDKKETFLNGQYLAMMNKALNGNQPFKQTKNAFHAFLKTLFFEGENDGFSKFVYARKIVISTFQSNLYTRLSSSPPTPPPEFL